MGRYGPDYQIDLDKQIARVRVTRPLQLDFAELALGVKKNNMGLAGFKLQANAVMENGQWVIQPSAQRFTARGATASEPLPAWRTFRVFDWLPGGAATLELLQTTK